MEKSKKRINDDESNGAAKVSEWVKKTILTGVGAVFMTEEGIRNAMTDLKLPKNVIASAVAQADKTKQEIGIMIANEFRRFLERIKVEDIIKKSLAGQTLEITATIKIGKPKKKAASKKTATPDEPKESL